jgi:hypothetical protein
MSFVARGGSSPILVRNSASAMTPLISQLIQGYLFDHDQAGHYPRA